MNTRKILPLFIVPAVSIILACAHAFQDTTNFTGPELKNYKKIVVLPFANQIDEYYVESLEKMWRGIDVVPLEKVRNWLEIQSIQSNRIDRALLRKIKTRFGADAVVKGTINSHYFSPLKPKDSFTHMTLHLTVYLVDLTTYETVACYHSEGWRRAFHSYRASDPEKYYRSLRYIASGNVKGLMELARTSGHLGK